MNLASIKQGDIVLVKKRGWTFLAFVENKEPHELAIKPIDSKANYYTASAREIDSHWAKRRRA